MNNKPKKITATISRDLSEMKNQLEYTDNLEPNSFFDELMKISHYIEVPEKYKKRLKKHVCMCGKLDIASLLPKSIYNDYREYSRKKSSNEIIDSMTNEIGKKISSDILAKIIDTQKSNN